MSSDVKLSTHTSLTRQQATALYESSFWESLAYVERARFQLSEDRLCMPFDVFLDAVERSLGRAVTVGEFLDSKSLLSEITGERRPLGIDELLELVPEKKRVLLAA